MSRSGGSAAVTSCPPIDTVPAVTFSRPAIMRRSVDFPQPDGPTSTRNSPSTIVSVTSSTARTPPGKALLTASISIAATGADAIAGPVHMTRPICADTQNWYCPLGPVRVNCPSNGPGRPDHGGSQRGDAGPRRPDHAGARRAHEPRGLHCPRGGRRAGDADRRHGRRDRGAPAARRPPRLRGRGHLWLARRDGCEGVRVHVLVRPGAG